MIFLPFCSVCDTMAVSYYYYCYCCCCCCWCWWWNYLLLLLLLMMIIKSATVGIIKTKQNKIKKFECVVKLRRWVIITSDNDHHQITGITNLDFHRHHQSWLFVLRLCSCWWWQGCYHHQIVICRSKLDNIWIIVSSFATVVGKNTIPCY